MPQGGSKAIASNKEDLTGTADSSYPLPCQLKGVGGGQRKKKKGGFDDRLMGALSAHP